MGITTGSGHKLKISSTAPGEFTAPGFAAIDTWELAPCAESLPELVKRLGSVSYACLYSGTTDTARGAAEAITWAPPIRDEPNNTAQMMMKAAFNAANGSPEELLSMRIEDQMGTYIHYAQAKVMAWGTGERTISGAMMRVVEFAIDARTLVEV